MGMEMLSRIAMQPRLRRSHCLFRRVVLKFREFWYVRICWLHKIEGSPFG